MNDFIFVEPKIQSEDIEGLIFWRKTKIIFEWILILDSFSMMCDV